ncbi:MAG: LacI family DNA-binding transcriptional regulator [Leucothrix sp.]
MSNRKPTLQDVANASGVSTATVSRCLNQPDKVSPDLQKKIRQVIEKLGYMPDGAARALASRRTNTIGAVVPTIDNAIFSKAIQYLQQGVAKAGYTLLLAQSSYSMDEELLEVQALITRGIDGLVLVGEDHHPAVYAAIRQQDIPHVNLWTYNPQSTFSCIGLNNDAAGRQIAKHLADLGHEKIGIITGILLNNDRAIQRYNGVLDYFKEKGIQIPEDCSEECRYSAEQGRQAIHKLMKRYPDTTAIICGNDILAIGALSGARELGLSVPERLSITGFDNMEIVSAIKPALTTMNSPSRRMGSRAANYIIEQISTNTRTVERIELTTDLVIRETTTAAQNPIKTIS